MARKKKVEQVEEQKVVNFPAEKVKSMPEPQQMTFRDFINNVSDATVDEIVKYINENKLIRKYIPVQELISAAARIVNEVCYASGKFVRNTSATRVRVEVVWVAMHLDLDFDNITYFDLYDIIKENEIDAAVGKIVGLSIPLHNLVLELIDDIDYNELSTAASMRRIADTVNTIVDTLNNGVTNAVNSPEIVKAIVQELTNNLEK